MPSPALESPQIRDFARRVLRPLAGRLAMGELEWTQVSLDRELRLDDGERQRIEFVAEQDVDSLDVTYRLFTSVAVPFDENWSTAAVFERAGASANYEPEDDGQVIEPDRAEESDEPESDNPEGYFGRDAEYIFYIPRSRRLWPRAEVQLSYVFYDEDFDPIDGGVATSVSTIPKSSEHDMDMLVKFGELMLVQETAEVDLLAVTEYDANFVLHLLKAMGLVRGTCKQLGGSAG